jgi:hypothetical protein
MKERERSSGDLQAAQSIALPDIQDAPPKTTRYFLARFNNIHVKLMIATACMNYKR